MVSLNIKELNQIEGGASKKKIYRFKNENKKNILVDFSYSFSDYLSFINVHKYGNTSAGTIPVALTEALEENKIKPGGHVLMASFGAGLTWGAGLVKWSDRVTPIKQSDASLPPCDKTALEIIEEQIKRCEERAKATA